MTKEQVKERLELVLGAINGEYELERLHSKENVDLWTLDYLEPQWLITFKHNKWDEIIRKKPDLVPFDMEDFNRLPVNAMFRSSRWCSNVLVFRTATHSTGITFSVLGESGIFLESYGDKTKSTEYSLDGKTWHPCTKPKS